MAYHIDTQHPGTVIRFFLAAEAIDNIIEGGFFFFWPHTFLRMILAEGTDIDAAHATLLRVFALVLVCCISLQTALCVPNTPFAIEGRKLLYLGYALVEGAGIAFFWYCGITGPESSGLDPESSKFMAKQLLVPFIGRFIPLWKTEYFGRYTIVAETGKKRA